MLPIIHCEPALRDDITVMLDEAAELEAAAEQYYLALRQTQGAIRTDRLDWRPQVIEVLRALQRLSAFCVEASSKHPAATRCAQSVAR